MQASRLQGSARTFVVWKVVLHGADGQLLLESVNLVQEQDDTGLDKPSRIANAVEEGEGFLHSVDGFIFEEQLVVLGDGDQKQNGGHILETMNPLLSLRALTTHIKHPICEVLNDEGRLCDTGGLDTRPKNILIVRQVIMCRNAVDRVKVTRVPS